MLLSWALFNFLVLASGPGHVSFTDSDFRAKCVSSALDSGSGCVSLTLVPGSKCVSFTDSDFRARVCFFHFLWFYDQNVFL